MISKINSMYIAQKIIFLTFWSPLSVTCKEYNIAQFLNMTSCGQDSVVCVLELYGTVPNLFCVLDDKKLNNMFQIFAAVWFLILGGKMATTCDNCRLSTNWKLLGIQKTANKPWKLKTATPRSDFARGKLKTADVTPCGD